MIGPDAIALPEWLRQLALLVAGDLAMDDARERLRTYGEALRSDFAPSVFTEASARYVARTANPKGFFPRYPEVCGALTDWAKANPLRPKALAGPAMPSAGRWEGFVAARLVAGADRANMLSLVRRYAAPEEVRQIMAAYFAEELRAEDHRAVGRSHPRSARAAE